jgi:nucleoside-diphosphate-sugar epimerase
MDVFLMKRKVFVTGGAGVIGRPLVGKLLQQGDELFVVDVKKRPEEWPNSLQYWQGDLNQIDRDKILRFNPDVCFHLAASFERTGESPEFFQTNFYNNILLSHALLHILQQCSGLKKVVFASSYLVYDPALYLFENPPKKRVSLSEDSSVNPRNLCGMAKLLHERELDFVSREESFTTVSARIFRVYGKGANDIISRWIRELIKGHPIEVFSAEGAFDYIYADDVAEGLLRLSNTDTRGVVNLGTGKSRRITEVLAVLKNHFPEMRMNEKGELPPYEASQASMERFVQSTGWKPTQTIEKMIPKIIAFEKG